MVLQAMLVIWVLSVVVERYGTAQFSTVIPFCFEDDCYIRPENTGRSWMDAQQICRRYNATLPIVDNPDRQRSVETALQNFTLSGTTNVWLGANASDYGSENWRWLDRRQYYGAIVLQGAGMYNKSYALLAKKATEVLAYASAPYETYSYICQYGTTTTAACSAGTGRLAFYLESKCYVKYSDKLSWFNARNICLQNGGDLASVSDVTLLDAIVDSNGSWISLRHSQWKWQNAVTGLSSDVTFTWWNSDQPNDPTPTCILIDYGNFPNWRDWNCSNLAQYICQVINSTWLVPTTTTSVDPNATSSSGDRASSTNYMYQSGSANDSQQNDRAVAVGVGIGVPCAIVILVLVVALIVQQRKLKRYSVNFKSEGSQIKDSKEISTSPPTSVLPAVENDANHQYQQLQNRIELQEQRQYEHLPQSQYEQLSSI